MEFDTLIYTLNQIARETQDSGVKERFSSLDQGKIEDVYRQLLTYGVDDYINE